MDGTAGFVSKAIRKESYLSGMQSILTALEAVFGRKLSPAYLLGASGKVIATAGIILIAIAAAIYLQFKGAQQNYISTPAVISRVEAAKDDPSLETIEFEYRLGDLHFQKSETSREFRAFNYSAGDTLHLLVDPESFDNFLYAGAESFYTDFGLNWSSAGLLALIVGGFLIRRSRKMGQPEA